MSPRRGGKRKKEELTKIKTGVPAPDAGEKRKLLSRRPEVFCAGPRGRRDAARTKKTSIRAARFPFPPPTGRAEGRGHYLEPGFRPRTTGRVGGGNGNGENFLRKGKINYLFVRPESLPYSFAPSGLTARLAPGRRTKKNKQTSFAPRLFLTKGKFHNPHHFALQSGIPLFVIVHSPNTQTFKTSH